MSSFAQKKAKTLLTRKRTMKRLRAEMSDDEDEDGVGLAVARPRGVPPWPERAASPPRAQTAAPAARRPRSLWAEPLTLKAAELVELRRAVGVLVRGEDAHLCPRPVRSSDDAALPPLFADAMRSIGAPTAIQAQAWPALLAGLDALCLAETGSGKTLAYVLPVLARAHATGRGATPTSLATDGGGGSARARAAAVRSLSQQPVALILAPTRELATQIALVARKAAKPVRLRAHAVYGGVPRAEQLAALATGCDVLVGTPGRVLDLISDGTGRPSAADAAAAARPADGESAKAAKRRKKAARAAATDAQARAPADVDLGGLVALVVDEADKMLAQGFHEQIDQILARVAEQRGGVAGGAPGAFGVGARRAAPGLAVSLFSSTMPGRLVEAAKGWTHRALFVRVNRKPSADDQGAAAEPVRGRALPTGAAGGARDATADGAVGAAELLATRVSSSVAQTVQVTAEHKKPRKLLAFLTRLVASDTASGARQRSRVLIFTNKVASTEAVCALLRRAGHKCGALHGERRQKEREAALADFRCGKVPLLVATDVAGRGLDVPKLPHVLNYDFPASLEAYVNRVGRAGRAGAQGAALSFFTRNLAKLAPDLVRMLEAAGQPVESYLRQLASAVEAGRAAEGDAVLSAAEAAEDE